MSTTITLRMPPELEAQIRQNAARRGQRVEDYLLSLAERDVVESAVSPLPTTRDEHADGTKGWEDLILRVATGHQPGPEERDAAFRELRCGIPTGVSLTDEDLRRESIYEESL